MWTSYKYRPLAGAGGGGVEWEPRSAGGGDAAKVRLVGVQLVHLGVEVPGQLQREGKGLLQGMLASFLCSKRSLCNQPDAFSHAITMRSNIRENGET